MKVLDDAKIFAKPDKKQEKALKALKDAMAGAFEGSHGMARKVISAKGEKSGAFAIIQGKDGSQLIPWVIIDKNPSKATGALKGGRAAIKAVASAGGKDLFSGGARFAKGSVKFENGRLVFEVVDGTLSASMVEKMFVKPARGLKSAKNGKVKQLIALLKQAVVKMQGEETPDNLAPATASTDEALSELFEPVDVSDLVSFTNDATAWNADLEDSDLEFERQARTITAEELLSAFHTSDDPIEQAELWIEYRRNSTTEERALITDDEDLPVGVFLDMNASKIGQLSRVRSDAERYRDLRERLLERIETISELKQNSEKSGETFPEEQQDEAEELFKEFEQYGLRIKKLQLEFELLVEEINQNAHTLG
jgi:hypothetical protein